MKLFITLFSLAIFSTNSIIDNSASIENDSTTYEVVFDGNEGGMCFFTDSKDQAITVEDEENKLFEKFNQDPNSFVGKTFTMLVKATDISDQGIYTAKSVVEFKIKENN